MLDGADVLLNTDFFSRREELTRQANRVLFTGLIDRYFDYCYGELEYRSLRFETEVLDTDNYQGNAAVNYTAYEVPYTRILEHKHFEFGTQEKTVITREYPAAFKPGDEPYYPVNDEKNNSVYAKYKKLADREANVFFGGRLAEYTYYDSASNRRERKEPFRQGTPFMNKETKSIGANVAYNLVFQVLNLVLPLITTPYLSRVLGSAGIGTYSYTNSIVQYFVLFGSVGLTLYGTRQVAYAREDKKKLSETFWNLYAFRALASGIALGLYLLIFSVIDTVYRPYLYCQGILIVSNMIDITWLFAGLEDFKKSSSEVLPFDCWAYC